MRPIHPIQDHLTQDDLDHLREYRSGPSWAAIAVVLLVVALIVVTALLFENNAPEAPSEPVPTEAPPEPGV